MKRSLAEMVGVDLAQKVVDTIAESEKNGETDFAPIYDEKLSIKEKKSKTLYITRK